MNFQNIILWIIVIVLLIIVYNYISSDVSTLSGLISAQTLQRIEASSLVQTNAVNFTYSIWFYVDDWNTNYGASKVIFGRMNDATSIANPCPLVTLNEKNNNVDVKLTVTNPLSVSSPPANQQFTCSVDNIPIQKWVHLLISVYGRTLDTYIDGKLVRTCVMPGIPVVNSLSPIYVTPNGGFSGWTSHFQYFGDATDPQTAWNIYKKGYGGSFLGNLFGSYAVKLSLINNNVETSSYTI
jgi:hypothetical protein